MNCSKCGMEVDSLSCVNCISEICREYKEENRKLKLLIFDLETGLIQLDNGLYKVRNWSIADGEPLIERMINHITNVKENYKEIFRREE